MAKRYNLVPHLCVVLVLVCAEKITEPTVFEALASLRGDVVNESVQHAELSTSLQRDVLDPLNRLREGGDTVQKLVSNAPGISHKDAGSFLRYVVTSVSFLASAACSRPR